MRKQANVNEKMDELSLHILDIVQNSIRAKATMIKISIKEDLNKDIYSINIEDNGHGMSPELLEKVCDPFFTTRTTRKVGMGISLLKQAAEHCNGSFSIRSEEKNGCQLEAIFQHSNIDRPVLGDISGTLPLIFAANPDIRFIYEHETNLSIFELDTNEIKQEIGNIPLSAAEVVAALEELIKENLKLIESKQ